MELVRLTPENASQYIGCEILFKTRGNHLIKRVLSVSNTGKTISIDHPDLDNALQLVTRKVYCILSKN